MITNEQEIYNRDWTLFLDRDGVINEELEGTYVTDWNEFKFYEGTLSAIRSLGKVFGHIIIVTNQRGVGRGIMSMGALKDIHTNMVHTIEENGGRIDRIYACTSVDDDDNNRKPNTGMALQAKEDFKQLDFRKCVMVGNNLSDMMFGKRMAMRTVFLSTTKAPVTLPHDLIDQQFDSLKAWTDSLKINAVATMN